jgi:hypothetical protein
MSLKITKEQMYNFVLKYCKSLPSIEDTEFEKVLSGYKLSWEENKKENFADMYTMITGKSMSTGDHDERIHLDIYSGGKKCRWFKSKTLFALGMYE